MARSRHERGKSQPVQQVVHRAELPADAELLLQNPPNILAAERADAVFRPRASRQPFAQAGLLVWRQRQPLAASRKVFQSLPAGSIEPLHPRLHLPTRQSHAPAHFFGRQLIECQTDRTQTLPQFRLIARVADSTIKLFTRPVRFHVHHDLPAKADETPSAHPYPSSPIALAPARTFQLGCV